MADLTTAQLTDYPRNIAELESSVYRQEEAKRHARRVMSWHKAPKKNDIPRPNCDARERLGQSPSLPPKPREPRMPDTDKNAWIKPFVKSLILAVLFAVLAIYAMRKEYMVISIPFVIGLAVFWYKAYSAYSKSPKKIKEVYQKRMDDYRQAMRIYERDYEAAHAAWEEYQKNYAAAAERDQKTLVRYQVVRAVEEVRYQAAVTQDQAAVAAAEEELRQMDAPLQETQALLARYYDLNIIFPKYRNMVAMTTIYEYFASGRCTELTGPDGAYNLYEAELRQDLIINKLDVIIRQLDQIQQNQYMLYQEMQRTRGVIQDIRKDVKDILENTADIAKSSHITALCTQVTAQNTEAIKYLSLING